MKLYYHGVKPWSREEHIIVLSFRTNFYSPIPKVHDKYEVIHVIISRYYLLQNSVFKQHNII